MRFLAVLLVSGLAAAQTTPSATYAFTVTEWVYEVVATCPCISSTSRPSSFTTTTTTSTSRSILIPDGSVIATTSASTTNSATGTSAGGISSVTPVSSSSISSSSPAPVSTTSSSSAVVTDAAYINQVLRHHNVHRANHSAADLVWSPSLAETARKIAQSCVYAHDTATDGGGYGQNIGAGYPPSTLGLASFITLGLYNSEVPHYTYFGGEPDLDTFGLWGHFTQVVWKESTSVGCYTADCSVGGLANVGGNVQPYFVVCNYAPPGNVLGAFTGNVGVSIGGASVGADY